MRDYLLYPGDGPPVGFFGYGHYNEDYVRQSGGWRIRRLILTRIGIDPLEGGLPSRRPDRAAVKGRNAMKMKGSHADRN
jgi:hypothetical protein